jgi:hypothetical protein
LRARLAGKACGQGERARLAKNYRRIRATQGIRRAKHSFWHIGMAGVGQDNSLIFGKLCNKRTSKHAGKRTNKYKAGKYENAKTTSIFSVFFVELAL